MAAAQRGIEINEYTPLQVKQAVVGYGQAVKKQVQEMTKNILKLSCVPKPDDTADALAMTICRPDKRLIAQKHKGIKYIRKEF